MVLKQQAVFCLTLFIACVNSDLYGSKEWVPQTKGAVWPRPKHLEQNNKFHVLTSKLHSILQTSPSLKSCITLEEALVRYEQIVKAASVINTNGLKKKINWNWLTKPWKRDVNYVGQLEILRINLTGTCNDSEYPSFDMEEDYTLEVRNGLAAITSNTVWGVLRGLESFSQLVYITEESGTLFINETTIRDSPHFKHRGLLLDTSRHFIPKKDILRTLDAMAYNKLNVFHWHLTDLQSFPYESKTFPELSEKGAWNPNYAIYTQTDVKEIIEYARKRGIRVLPEFDTPGHTASWGDSHKELLTPCYENGEPNGRYGPLDVTKNFTYTFVEKLLTEVSQVFPEQYIHIGGDEVQFDCWQSNPDVNAWMTEHDMIGDYAKLESYYVQKVVEMVNKTNSKSIVWEEVFTTGVEIPNTTLVEVWIADTYKEVLSAATKAGKNVLLSACYYLDVDWEWLDWSKFYNCEPTDFDGTEEQKKLVLGGEIALWSEFVNEYNLDSKLWPRGSAGAERLWSQNITLLETTDYIPAATRLEEHLCRLIKRGVHATPSSGPNYCL